MLRQIIEDDALYPGHVVKRLLQVQSGSNGRAVRWMPAKEAATRLGRKPDTFRKQCERYAKMDNPPIRVRKAGPTKKSPWEVCEDDVFALERRRQVRLYEAPESELAPAVVEVQKEMDESAVADATVQYWVGRATRNL